VRRSALAGAFNTARKGKVMKITQLAPPTNLEPDIAAVGPKGDPCTLAHPSSFYSGEAISTRGTRYTFWARGELYVAMREEMRGRIHVGTPITPPPALKSAIRSAIQNVVRET
jgi:hypothetical protein